jgi:hypothetical protein
MWLEVTVTPKTTTRFSACGGWEDRGWCAWRRRVVAPRAETLEELSPHDVFERRLAQETDRHLT